MEIFLLLTPFVVILVGGLYLALKSKSGRTYDRDSVDIDTKRQIEDLHKMQTHMFWRDFGK